MPTEGNPVASLFPLNLSQTPVSRTGTTSAGGSSTGAFFSTPQTDFQGPSNLLTGGATVSAGGIGSVAIAVAVLGFALLVGGKK
ncbi:MAG: hypothetical protein KDJ15_07940 [Alphaproteobacteria bacterium]|nr:hypothetical protein [Alphaproteobacteria bacterium]